MRAELVSWKCAKARLRADNLQSFRLSPVVSSDNTMRDTILRRFVKPRFMASCIADSQGKVIKETYSEKFAALLTGLYAEQQTAAAEKCGVSGGEAWRVAFESASNSGARQVCILQMHSITQ